MYLLLNTGGFVRIEYYDPLKPINERWVSHISFDITSMSKLKNYLKNYSVLFPKNVNKFRFIVTKDVPTGDKNKCRVVLNNIKIYCDDLGVKIKN